MSHALAYTELPALPTTPYWARRHAAAVLGAWQIDTETTETTLLLVSELVTNAVAATATLSGHDTTTSAPITQTLRRQDGQIIIEISDPDPRLPILTDTGPDAESGRGLLLVHALVKEWSCYHQLAGGKTVYCVFPIPDDTSTQPLAIAAQPDPASAATPARQEQKKEPRCQQKQPCQQAWEASQPARTQTMP